MVTKSKLRLAIAAEKGTDFKKIKQKRLAKAADKRRHADGGAPLIQGDYEEIEIEEAGTSESDESKDKEEDSDEGENEKAGYAAAQSLSLDAVDESDTSESSIEFEKRLPRPSRVVHAVNAAAADSEDEDPEEQDAEEDIAVSDLEDLDDAEKEDLIPHTRLTINNATALFSSLKRIALPTAPFALHQSVLSTAPTAESIPDISDDLQRELSFYSQSLEAARLGRARLRAEGVPFSRPKDYFAEMVKEDAHMEKVKAKLVEEASNKKAAAEARKLRDLKKFGKQVQVAKLQERQKAKRETLDKIKNLKRKRSENGADLGTNEADLFDVGVDKELSKPSASSSRAPGAGRGGLNTKRQKKNEKFGFGGKKRHSKSGDAISSGDISGFNPKQGGGAGRISKGRIGKTQRPGKSRRQAKR